MKHAVVLDFDGTMCRLFENYDLGHVKIELQSELRQFGIQFLGYDDCFDVYKAICAQLPDDSQKKIAALAAAERIIAKAECDAVDTGTDIAGLKKFIEYCKEHGILLGIATNNSAECIEKYMLSRGIDRNIPIVGRDVNHPEHMKPSPWTLKKVINLLGVGRESVIFVGDNPTDYLCAVAADVDFIGIAPTEKKKKRFEQLHNTIQLAENYYKFMEILCLNR